VHPDADVRDHRQLLGHRCGEHVGQRATDLVKGRQHARLVGRRLGGHSRDRVDTPELRQEGGALRGGRAVGGHGVRAGVVEVLLRRAPRRLLVLFRRQPRRLGAALLVGDGLVGAAGRAKDGERRRVPQHRRGGRTRTGLEGRRGEEEGETH